MSNVYTWVISELQCYPQKDGFFDVVFILHWRRRAVGETHSAEVYGAQQITFDPAKPFTPYKDLTFVQICGWLEGAMGEARVAELDAELDKQIDNQKNLPVVVSALPWTQ